MDGILNIYKEKGFTSHDVVAVVRKILNQKKVGHTGTLDPDAEGVLPICFGKATKLVDYIMAEKKGYKAVITFGVTTSTQDSSGDIIETKKFEFDENKIIDAVYSFKGEIMQIPPMYSALKVNGKKLYEIARQGGNIDRSARKINIFDIKISRFMPPDKAEIDVICSKGTYIRTLCFDIGEKLGCGAHMSKLLRTFSGSFEIDKAVKLDDLKQASIKGNLSNFIISMDTALNRYNKIFVAEEGTKLLHNGCKIYDYFFKECSKSFCVGDIVTAYDYENTLIGIYSVIFDKEKNKTAIKPLKILL